MERATTEPAPTVNTINFTQIIVSFYLIFKFFVDFNSALYGGYGYGGGLYGGGLYGGRYGLYGGYSPLAGLY